MRQLHREGHLNAGLQLQLTWKGNQTAEISVTSNAAILAYRYKDRKGEWHDVNQQVCIAQTPCHFGGTRPWFNCPQCQQRVAILYLWNAPVCRRCARLTYSSQSDDPVGRSWRRTRKIERRLAGGTGKWNFRRPKGMRMATYERLTAAYWHEEQVRAAALVAFASRLCTRLRH
ncbi:hypothetical protein [Rhodanobacter sp. OR87]|uniref:hypothetical protein n=1 Tax=Rhodanobacter sp. OR87 TaxID=1076523 RepID=UPI0012DD618A|nr:hypothetical protein [Rhodanobacter sp. OR87]